MGNFGGISSFELSSTGVVKIGPLEEEIPPASTSVPRLQLASSNLVAIETNGVGTSAAVAFVDNSQTTSNPANGESGIAIQGTTCLPVPLRTILISTDL